MKLNAHTLLPVLIMLGGGMAVGSIHNAMSHGRIDAAFGYIALVLLLLMFLAGLGLLRYYDDRASGKYGIALGLALFIAVMGIINAATTPTWEAMLFHEYLLPITGVLQTIKLFTERSSAGS